MNKLSAKLAAAAIAITLSTGALATNDKKEHRRGGGQSQPQPSTPSLNSSAENNNVFRGNNELTSTNDNNAAADAAASAELALENVGNSTSTGVADANSVLEVGDGALSPEQTTVVELGVGDITSEQTTEVKTETDVLTEVELTNGDVIGGDLKGGDLTNNAGDVNINENNRFINIDAIDLFAAATHSSVELCTSKISGGLSTSLFNVFNSAFDGDESISLGFNLNYSPSKKVLITGSYTATGTLNDGTVMTIEKEGQFTVEEMAGLSSTQRKEVYDDMPKKEAELGACLVDEFVVQIAKINATYNGLAKNNDLIGAHNTNLARVNGEYKLKLESIKGANQRAFEWFKHCTNNNPSFDVTKTTTGEGENTKTVIEQTVNPHTIDYRTKAGNGHATCEVEFKSDTAATRAVLTTPIVPVAKGAGLLLDHN